MKKLFIFPIIFLLTISFSHAQTTSTYAVPLKELSWNLVPVPLGLMTLNEGTCVQKTLRYSYIFDDINQKYIPLYENTRSGLVTSTAARAVYENNPYSIAWFYSFVDCEMNLVKKTGYQNPEDVLSKLHFYSETKLNKGYTMLTITEPFVSKSFDDFKGSCQIELDPDNRPVIYYFDVGTATWEQLTSDYALETFWLNQGLVVKVQDSCKLDFGTSLTLDNDLISDLIAKIDDPEDTTVSMSDGTPTINENRVYKTKTYRLDGRSYYVYVINDENYVDYINDEYNEPLFNFCPKVVDKELKTVVSGDDAVITDILKSQENKVITWKTLNSLTEEEQYILILYKSSSGFNYEWMSYLTEKYLINFAPEGINLGFTKAPPLPTLPGAEEQDQCALTPKDLTPVV